MMRSQSVGSGYLAGFVIAAGFLYLAATSITAAFAWRDSYHPWLLMNWAALGLVPSIIAVVLGRRAWSAHAAGPSAVALVILVIAIALWQLFVVTF